MKLVGQYTARGTLSETDAVQRINLFDGRFDTGYKVVDFRIWGGDFQGSSQPDVIGKLATEPGLERTTATFMRAADNREIAWAASAGSTDGGLGFAEAGVIDPDNIIVEDLYVYVRGATNTSPVNYMVVMEKYDISLNVGAYSMVRNSGQDINSQDR
jgi:hypothetical protein